MRVVIALFIALFGLAPFLSSSAGPGAPAPIAPRTFTVSTDPAAPAPAAAPATPDPVEAEPAEVEPEASTDDRAEQPAPDDVTLAPVTAYRDQGAIDDGSLVLWRQLPYLLAAHEHLGWGWLDDIPVGTRVVVTTGPAAGAYVVVGHDWMPEQGGEMPASFADYDLVLQTCTGTSGSGFTLAVRA